MSLYWSFTFVLSFIDYSSSVLGKVVKSVFALWALEVACIVLDCGLMVITVRLLYQKHLRNTKQGQGNDDQDQSLFGQSITTSRYLKWVAIFGAAVSSLQWICAAFSFSISRYIDEICIGMEYNSQSFRPLQSWIFDPSTCVKPFNRIFIDEIACFGI
jgi:hypothetical protein